MNPGSYAVLAALAVSLTVSSATAGKSSTFRAPPVAAEIPGSTAGARWLARYGELPIRFEPNVGQASPRIKYLARGNQYIIFIDEQAVTVQLQRGAVRHTSAAETRGSAAALMQSPALLRLHPLHARAAPPLLPERRQRSVSDYFVGNDPSKWQTHIANYTAVRYRQLYPGIDWVIYGNPQQLEYDFVVEPRADPRQIAIDVEGASSVSEDADGDLRISVKRGVLRQLRPVVYQITATGTRRSIAGRYVLRGDLISFSLGRYDRNRRLIIDPAFVYSTYLGGSGGDGGTAIAVDAQGNAYVTGSTASIDFPTADALQSTNNSIATSMARASTVFVSKLTADGSALVYSTYLGGSGLDAAKAIAVDGAGDAYVAGWTTSSDFPTVVPFQSANHATVGDFLANAFVAKLNATGDALVYSTYLGGSGCCTNGSGIFYDSANAIAVDTGGDAYVAGATVSSDFPTVNPLQASNNAPASVWGGNAFVAKFNPAGSALVYSTYLGGSYGTEASGIAVDGAGNAYVVGGTDATDFPTVKPIQTANNAIYPIQQGAHPSTGFVSKLNMAGSALVYSTYLGGSSQSWVTGIAVDDNGDAYVVGSTEASDFPTTHPLQAANHAAAQNTPLGGNGFNAFIAKFNAVGSALVYSTYLGGSTRDEANAVAIDAAGNAYVAGLTFSDDFPLEDPLQDTNRAAAIGAADAFVSALDSAGSALMFSTYLGGSGSVSASQIGQVDDAAGIAIDGTGNIYMTGSTSSSDFPTMMPFQSTNNGAAAGSGTAFVTKIATANVQEPASGMTGGSGAMGWDWISVLAFAALLQWRRRLRANRRGAIGGPGDFHSTH